MSLLHMILARVLGIDCVHLSLSYYFEIIRTIEYWHDMKVLQAKQAF
jgi:hypothetical protein